MEALSMSPGGELKGIPLRKLPKEAWTPLQGEDVGDVPGGLDIVDLYERVAWLNRGVDLIAEAVSSMPHEYHAVSTGAPTEDPPEFSFDLDLPSLINELTGDLLLHGRGYVMLERNAFMIKKVRRLYPPTVQPRWDKQKGLIGFKRTVNGQALDLELNEIIYIWTPNRKGETGYGKSKAFAALRAAGFLDNIDVFGGKFFAQGTMRPNIIFVDGNPPESETRRIESFFQRMASGVANAFRTVAVSKKVEAVTFGEIPGDLAMPELTDKKREDISTALGVPHSLLFSNAANYATARQDDLHFYDKTVLPLVKLVFRRLSEGVFEPFGFELRPHQEKLEIYQYLESEKAEALALMHDRHVIDTNEFRDAMSFEQIDGLSEAEGDLVGWSAARTGEQPPPAGNAPPGAQQPGQAQDGDAIMEMRAWRRWIEKRITSGKGFTRDFETRHINPTLKASLSGALSEAATPEERKAIFAGAERFVRYP